MIGDDVRIQAYARALEESIKPGMTVVDLGAGTGIFSLLACRFGAKKVHAIECSEILEVVGREFAERNGCGDRIEWHIRSSREVDLSSPADLLVADIRGALPFHESSVESWIDARDRLLRRGGRMIPRRDVCRIALAESPRLERDAVRPWGENHLGFDWSPMTSRLSNEWRRASIREEELLSEPGWWHTDSSSGSTPS